MNPVHRSTRFTCPVFFKWHYVKPGVDLTCVVSTAVERFHTQTVELKGSGEWEIVDSGEVVPAVEDADA